MSIRIGNQNKIKNTSIGHRYNTPGIEKESEKKENYAQRHPLIISFLLSMGTGFILLFSFWESLIGWLENLMTKL